MKIKEKIYKLLEKIPEGKITTYSDLAKKAGNKKASRAVGNILRNYPNWENGNCYRVVKKNGEVGKYLGRNKNTGEKIKRLKKIGCKIENGRVVNLEEKLW